MKYKGILLDIDNTLYDYKTAHNFSKNKVLNYCVSEFDCSQEKINMAYEKARKQVHVELSETASSHNRLLYFQKMLEIINVNPMKYAYEIYSKYWDNFLDRLNPYDEIYILFEKYKNRICLVTDLTADIQYRKIQKLGLQKYCNKLVTSEEAGREKPHPYMFMLALQKLGLRVDEVCMIGDNFQKDIIGSASLGIESIWFNHESIIEVHNDKLITEAKSFKEILELL